MSSGTRVTLVLLTLLGCVGCDQASKAVARSFLEPGRVESLFHDVLRLELAANSGAFLSLGASLSENLRFVIFTAGTAALVTGMLWVGLLARRLDQWRVVAVGLITGGGLSNLLDRLIDAGRVTDFLNVGIGSLRSGIFNVADMAILVGGMLLMFGHRRQRRGDTPPTAGRA